MLAAWIETPAKGRNGGPVRAGMWSTVVIGSHPIQDSQRAWLDAMADDLPLGLLPAYWIENKAGNSFWYAPLPPQGVGARLHYRAVPHSPMVRIRARTIAAFWRDCVQAVRCFRSGMSLIAFVPW